MPVNHGAAAVCTLVNKDHVATQQMLFSERCSASAFVCSQSEIRLAVLVKVNNIVWNI